MTDYQEPVKDDLWAAIEQSLAQETNEKTATIRQLSLRRISIAAAISALAVGGTYVFLHPWSEDTDAKVASVINANDKAQTDLMDTKKAVPSNTFSLDSEKPSFAASKSMLAAVKSVLTSRKPTLSSSPALASASDIETSEHSEAANPVSSELQVPVSSSSSVNKNGKKEAKHNDLRRDFYSANSHAGNRKSQNTLAFNVYGENGFVGNNNSGNQSPFMSDAMADPVPPMYTSNSNEYTPVFDSKVMGVLAAQEYQQKAKHHLPVSVGLQVGFGIAPRLRLTTGVVYTKASSDFTVSAHNNETVTTQDLHYVGIPLNLSYEVWGTKQFHAYLTVGGEGDVNVKNDTKTDGVETSSKRDRMQWSGKASVGAQFDVIPQLGIYVEPGAKYYFDNGSQIENTFKDKKLNFNFQFGLRWNVGK